MSAADGQGTIYISYEEWTEFVMKNAPFLKSTQFALNAPRDTGDGIEIDYAFGDEVHPRDWGVKPEWLKGGTK